MSIDPEDIPVPALMLSRGGRVEWVSSLARSSFDGELEGKTLGSIFCEPSDVEQRLVGTHEEGGATVEDARARDESGGRCFDLHGRALGDGRRLLVMVPSDRVHAERERRVRLEAALREAERDRARMGELQRALSGSDGAPRIIGSSARKLAMKEQVRRVAPSPSTVLVQGESGTGKELVARALHDLSGRAERPFVAVNCAAMPETLIESELFGHERGAFTGAERRRAGKFELADGGTLFLDEVAELSPQAQAKLLRVLQEGAFERVGGTETVRVDVRVVTATHRDLAGRISSGRFREDLYYRLNVFRIDVPPLRERMEDLRELVEHFHRTHARRMAREVLPISERSYRRMRSYRWPGNVRELENAVERATLLASGGELEIELPAGPSAENMPSGGGGSGTSDVPRDVLLDLSIEQLSRLQIMHALETCGYRVFGPRGAAEKLGINPRTLISRMNKLGLPRPSELRRSLSGD